MRPGDRIGFRAARGVDRDKCAYCYREARGLFLRRGLRPLPACHRHYRNALARIVGWLRGAK